MTNPERLTILVTTYNRYPSLLRLLKYAAAVRVPYPIHVLDSSTDPIASDELQRCLEAPGVLYRRYDSTTSPMHKLREGLNKVSTPFVVQWADDDFLVPGSLEAGVDFLDTHPTYSIVHGRGAIFTMERQNGTRLPGFMPYWQRAVVGRSAAQRLQDYLDRYAVFNYSVHRTEHLARHVSLCCEHGFGYHWGELALGSLSVIQGNAHMLNRLYLVKETHREPDAWLRWLEGEACQRKGNAFDWITQEEFPAGYRVFRDCLASEISRVDGLSPAEAQEVIRIAFWRYLSMFLTRNWHRLYGPPSRRPLDRARAAARTIPGLRRLWRRARYWVPHRRETLSLPALLRSSSLYHADFMPVYRAVTTDGPPDRDEQ